MTDGTAVDAPYERVEFDGLTIGFDARVLRPRAWTELQSRWAAELLATLPPGPVLELCCGAGQIGLAAVARGSRPLVCVDRDRVAADFARANAERAGLGDRVEVRGARLEDAVGDSERFALVIADPPWVSSRDTARWPADPPGAIDGGPDGLDVARLCLEVAAGHLMRGGAVLLQLGDREQADRLRVRADALDLPLVEVRTGERGVVALFCR
jgi:release factor glutamine methyltransferase